MGHAVLWADDTEGHLDFVGVVEHRGGEAASSDDELLVVDREAVAADTPQLAFELIDLHDTFRCELLELQPRDGARALELRKPGQQYLAKCCAVKWSLRADRLYDTDRSVGIARSDKGHRVITANSDSDALVG